LADGVVGGSSAASFDGGADDGLYAFSNQGRNEKAGGAMNRRPVFLITVLCFGFAFFYIPILSMMVYSFNASKLVTVWGGFSTKWYVSLWSNKKVVDALILSLQIAVLSSTFATILGTMAGIALARFRRFRGRVLFSGLVTAPLIMPEVITGISSLMMFILMAEWIGWPGARGFTTITLAHITFSMVFVTTIIHSRMVQADLAIEEAALDLGSRPWQVMRDITLPVISPAILSGWLLAFTISLDDVVITSFTTGPGNTTLPLLIWSKVRLGVTPDINALATITVVVVGVGVALSGWILNRAEKRHRQDLQLAYRSNG
jgi:putrescine transport system permease protein